MNIEPMTALKACALARDGTMSLETFRSLEAPTNFLWHQVVIKIKSYTCFKTRSVLLEMTVFAGASYDLIPLQGDICNTLKPGQLKLYLR